MARSANRSLWLLGAAMAYIIAQFGWWALLLLRREEEIARLSGQELGHQARRLMVLGEASVALMILGVVLVIAFLAIRRDLRLAAMQRNFLLAITHELRTPIASMKLQMQTLSRPGLSPSDARALQALAIEEADRLTALTDKVLAATAEGTVQIPMLKEPVNAAEVVRGVVWRAQQRDGSAHEWLLDAPAVLQVNADPQALRSIAENLIENAMKYAPGGTTIEVMVSDTETAWRLRVIDHGPGIPLAERSKVFERFYRLGDEATRNHRGTGLGLFVVQRLVQRHGGRIELGDTDPHGATFVATFPKTT